MDVRIVKEAWAIRGNHVQGKKCVVIIIVHMMFEIILVHMIVEMSHLYLERKSGGDEKSCCDRYGGSYSDRA